MVNLTINGKPVRVANGTSIMDAARTAGFDIPHLCYLKELNVVGACRMCCVEVEGESKLVSACENKVSEGMVVHTNNDRVRKAQKTNLELILSRHNGYCPTCIRNGNCQLQSLAEKFGITDNRFGLDLKEEQLKKWNAKFPLIRDNSKCIKCMRCINICDKVQSMKIWDMVGAGSRTEVNVRNGEKIEATSCTLCGQCITHCPVGALKERNDVDSVLEALDNPEVITVVQIAPAVRAAWGEAVGLDSKTATVKKLAGTLRAAGFKYVFDTCFTADLTIMEEGSEFLERLKKGDLKEYPMFTSCCPGWVRFIKSEFPSLVKQLSTAKSPQQMFGSVIKTYFAKKIGVQPSKIVSVSIMPCVAKKGECAMPVMQTNGIRDVDYVLTTREVVRLLRSRNVNIKNTPETEFDSIMQAGTGAGVIFGATGGVMEAALRSAYYLVMGKNPDADAFKVVRSEAKGSTVLGEKPWREAEFDLNGTKLRVAVTSSLSNARKLCQAVLDKKVKFDFVEIMACPGGCAGGGGQIIRKDDSEPSAERGAILFRLDSEEPVRFSHENPDVQKLYAEELGKPLSEKSEALLHTDHFAKC